MTYSIGELAGTVGVSVETIRYYHRRGLLSRPPKPSRGYRSYSEDARRRLRFILEAKELGFTLREILELLELRTDSPSACAEIEEVGNRCVARIDDQIRALRQMKRALATLVEHCGDERAGDVCPIIAALEATESDDRQGER